jgi:hypothetical protein
MKKGWCMFLIIYGCNSYNRQMNNFLVQKKDIEIKIDSNNQRDQRLRVLTGYSEILDSLSVAPQYQHPELVDSIRYLKEEKLLLENNLQKIKYSIDSLQKLKP